MVDLHHGYRDLIVLDGVSLQAADGELVALLGPSGSGKTTLLRCIAGLERPSLGSISIAGAQVADSADGTFIGPEHRGLGMVFQDGALFPHLDVSDNVGFGLPRGQRRGSRVSEALEMVGLGGYEHRNVASLSGGQRQRVALARALAPRPALLLLDEPFSNLDALLRAELRAEVRDLLSATSTTALWVTHDRSEAFLIADSVAVLRDGRIAQQASPRELYDHPVDPWVAEFVGDVNLVPGVSDGACTNTPVGRLMLREPLQGPVQVLVRPEQLRLTTAPEGNLWHITAIDFEGHDQVVRLNGLLDGLLVRSRDRSWSVGDVVGVGQIDGLVVTGWPTHG
ncbi:MAG: ABC transporter ATP-binding protein [Microthrixaceae bacterium]|nr:ABC transporter ATP-binding protein [Microthrixaceae bacterium]